jgi:hypothetical protein
MVVAGARRWLDAVACEPATTSTSRSCTFGKRLSPRLFLKALPEVTGGDREHYGADLLWRHRW